MQNPEIVPEEFLQSKYFLLAFVHVSHLRLGSVSAVCHYLPNLLTKHPVAAAHVNILCVKVGTFCQAEKGGGESCNVVIRLISCMRPRGVCCKSNRTLRLHLLYLNVFKVSFKKRLLENSSNHGENGTCSSTLARQSLF